ncbi:MAG: DoxX-like family protein [Bacteroidota bacterium]
MEAAGIYVEATVQGSMDELWDKTQDPALHEQWDLRFSEIHYLPRDGADENQRFRYATRIGFGLRIEGDGESVAEKRSPDGVRTSALKFSSNDPKSLIREGSGYWRYVPTPDGVRFLTWYSYKTRHAAVGRAFDRFAFRPAMGWATAWSFDCLRLWIEQGIPPRVSVRRAQTYAVARIALALLFLYHGLVPKLLAQHPDELALVLAGGVSPSVAPFVVQAIGTAEVLWAGLLFVLWRARWPLVLTAALMVVALASVAATAPGYLVAAFNPVTLNLAVIALCGVAWLSGADLPSARRCLRIRPDPAQPLST